MLKEIVLVEDASQKGRFNVSVVDWDELMVQMNSMIQNKVLHDKIHLGSTHGRQRHTGVWFEHVLHENTTHLNECHWFVFANEWKLWFEN